MVNAIIDVQAGCPLAILPDRRKESPERFLRGIPSEVKARIREVCIDMDTLLLAAVEQELSEVPVSASASVMSRPISAKCSSVSYPWPFCSHAYHTNRHRGLHDLTQRQFVDKFKRSLQSQGNSILGWTSFWVSAEHINKKR
jgi:hypothetical protein